MASTGISKAQLDALQHAKRVHEAQSLPFTIGGIAPQIDEHEDMSQAAIDQIVGLKYDEGRILEDIREYVRSTYGKHYVGDDGVQAFDLIASIGHAEGYGIGNCIKYAARYGKKAGKNRDDMMKLIHYAMLVIWDLDKQQAHEDREYVSAYREQLNFGPVADNADDSTRYI